MAVHSFTGARLDKPVSHVPDRPILTVVVDTEEEFNWNAPFSRANTGTKSATSQELAHEIFDPLGIVPAYVVDQAIVDSDVASDYFSGLKAAGRCEIGMHLHAWLTPPFDEDVCDYNSFQGNLRPALEFTKMSNLKNAISQCFGEAPTIFKAGRYGVGPQTFDILKQLGFKIVCSVTPHTSYAEIGGPNFHGLPATPFWIDEDSSLLGLPLTRGFTGAAAACGPKLKGLFDFDIYKRLKVPAILSRSGLVERVTLTPEGVPAADQKKLLQRLFNQGERFFSLAYHSSSMGVGHTPYVQS
ncbi:MAG: hypothetical protein JKY34_15610, partial [Kordiimonadaceae bacterium]|nr:hypothetical protein [Kordiimonadaceae bacterium]